MTTTTAQAQAAPATPPINLPSHIEHLATATLVPYARNSRTHSPEQVQAVARSIQQFGFTNPVLVDANNTIIAGHGRVMAAQQLGLALVPCIRLAHLTDAQRRAYVIADNKLAELSGWDMATLAREVEDLMHEDAFEIDLLGFGADELQALLAEHAPEKPPETAPTENDADATPEPPAIPTSRTGDVWLCGKHRVMCGDSTSNESVGVLLDGKKAEMVFTDPPYNVKFSGALSSTSKDGRLVPMARGYVNPSSTHEEIKNDNMGRSDFRMFMLGVLSVVKNYCIGGFYICFSSSTLDELLVPLGDAGIGWKSIIVWNKNQSPMGGGHFRRKYEPIAYGYFENNFYGREYAEDDVWDINRTLKNDLHPTMKPVALVERAVGYSSKPGGTVLDLFGGSGTTLIACENTKRVARLMELDPKYCDVIINRWQAFTGNQAKLEATGQTFAQVQAQRVGSAATA